MADVVGADVMYTVEVVELYKAEPDSSYGLEISFVADGDVVPACTMDLRIGQEYLLDLWRYEPTGDPRLDGHYSSDVLRSVGMCGAWRPWRLVVEEDLEILQDECQTHDACTGSCGEFQVR